MLPSRNVLPIIYAIATIIPTVKAKAKERAKAKDVVVVAVRAGPPWTGNSSRLKDRSAT